MLERLDRGNLFVVALDDERVWYRYYHLFAEFLRSRLNVDNPRLAGELHLRASHWYEDDGLLVEAIGHALLCSGADPAYEQAARLIERGVKEAWSRGEGPAVLRWVSALPDEAKRRRPRLILEHAQALALVGRLDESEPLLDEGKPRLAGPSSEAAIDCSPPPHSTLRTMLSALPFDSMAPHSWNRRNGGAVILRIWRARLETARIESYRRFEAEQCLPMLHKQPGFLGVFFLREAADNAASITIWEDRGAVEALESSPSYLRAIRELAEGGLLVGEPSVEVLEIEGGDLRPEALVGALARTGRTGPS